MTQNSHKSNDISLTRIYHEIKEYKKLLLLFPILVFFLSFVVFSYFQTYKNTLSFKYPEKSTILKINKSNILNKSKKNILNDFYNIISNDFFVQAELKKSSLGEELTKKNNDNKLKDFLLKDYLTKYFYDSSDYTFSKFNKKDFDRDISFTIEGKFFDLQGSFLVDLFNTSNKKLLEKYAEEFYLEKNSYIQKIRSQLLKSVFSSEFYSKEKNLALNTILENKIDEVSKIEFDDGIREVITLTSSPLEKNAKYNPLLYALSISVMSFIFAITAILLLKSISKQD